MKTAFELYRRIPPKFRLPVSACLLGLLILLLFTGMAMFWAVKAALVLDLKLIALIAFCLLVYKIRSTFKS